MTRYDEDTCPGCGAEWTGYGAFACGWPSADCFAMTAAWEAEAAEAEEAATEEAEAEAFELERAAWVAEFEAWETLLDEGLGSFTEADALAMDELEEELFPRETMEFELKMGAIRAEEALAGYVFRG